MITGSQPGQRPLPTHPCHGSYTRVGWQTGKVVRTGCITVRFVTFKMKKGKPHLQGFKRDLLKGFVEYLLKLISSW